MVEGIGNAYVVFLGEKSKLSWPFNSHTFFSFLVIPG
jgi:hypothetical protein